MLFQSYKKEDRRHQHRTMINIHLDDEYEYCVLCKKKTDIKKSEPVESRIGYLQGAGQLCNECRLKNIEEKKVGMQKKIRLYNIDL